MEDNSRLKIGFYAYTTTVLWKYWQRLRSKSDCWWVANNAYVYNELKKMGHEKIILEKIFFKGSRSNIIYKILRGIYFFLKNPNKLKVQKVIFDRVNPDIWISDTTLRLINFDIPSMKVLVFHSVPYKRYCFIPESLKYDLILLPGEYHKRKMCELFGNNIMNKLEVVGWPRSDDFVNKKLRIEAKDSFLEKLGLNNELKTVMYAPTWDSFCKNRLFPKSFGDNAEALDAFCRKFLELNLNLIIRLHPVMFNLIENKKLHRIAKKYKACWLHDKIRAYAEYFYENFLWVTDILISDTSGIITDFMVLNRPIIYVEPDSREFNWEDADLPKEFRVGRVVASLEELIEAVKSSLANPDEYKQKREKVLKKVFYKLDGKSTERATNAILERYKEFKNHK